MHNNRDWKDDVNNGKGVSIQSQKAQNTAIWGSLQLRKCFQIGIGLVLQFYIASQTVLVTF